MKEKLYLTVALLFSWAFTVVFITPWCGALFGCGCTWLWAGADSQCVGMHDHAGMQHHCPWCVDGTSGFLIPVAVIIIAQTILVIVTWRRYRANLPVQFIAGIIGFLAAGFLEALVHGWVKGYPYWSF